MITIPREAAIALIRNSLAGFSPYFGDPDTVEFRERELLNGCKWWLERKAELSKDDLFFALMWGNELQSCQSLEDVSDKFLEILLSDYDHQSGTLNWLMNAQQV